MSLTHPRHSPLTSRLIVEGLDARNLRPEAHGPLRFMVSADGYVMARRPDCVPVVITETEWRKLQERAA